MRGGIDRQGIENIGQIRQMVIASEKLRAAGMNPECRGEVAFPGAGRPMSIRSWPWTIQPHEARRLIRSAIIPRSMVVSKRSTAAAVVLRPASFMSFSIHRLSRASRWAYRACLILPSKLSWSRAGSSRGGCLACSGGCVGTLIFTLGPLLCYADSLNPWWSS